MKDTQKIRGIFPKKTQFVPLNLYSFMFDSQRYPEKMIKNKGDIYVLLDFFLLRFQFTRDI